MEPQANGLQIVGQIEALHLAPGDQVVITIPDRIPHDALISLMGQAQAMFPDHKCIVLYDGAKLDIVREADPADGRP